MAFCLTKLQTRLTHSIIVWLVTTHSVLGGTQSAITPGSANLGHVTIKALALTLPIEWANHLIALCLYTAAMIAVSALVPRLIAGQRSSRHIILSTIRESGSRILLFAFKILLLIGAAAPLMAAFTALVLSIESKAHISPGPSMFYAFFTAALLLFAAIAYLMAPSAVALLRSREAEPISTDAIRLARTSAVLAELASGALSLLATRIGHSFISATTSTGQLYAIQAAESLFTATPYILLFIALSLLATTANPSSTFTTESVESIFTPTNPPSEHKANIQ